MRINLLIVVALLLTACADTASRLNEMSVGMTKSDVTELLGEPQTTTGMNGTEYMTYELRDAPDAVTQAACGVAGIYTFGLAAAMDDCQYSDELYYIRLVDGEVDAYGQRDQVASNNGKEILSEIPELGIEDTHISGPDSVGGVDVGIDFKVGSQKTVKYIRFWTVPYNSVGDIVRSIVDQESEKILESVGPYAGNGSSERSAWKTVWYNPSISCFEITKVEIEFMDGSIESYDNKELNLAFTKSDLNDCSYGD